MGIIKRTVSTFMALAAKSAPKKFERSISSPTPPSRVQAGIRLKNPKPKLVKQSNFKKSLFKR